MKKGKILGTETTIRGVKKSDSLEELRDDRRGRTTKVQEENTQR